MKKYKEEDVVLTEFGEIMYYKEANNTNTLIERKATNKEAELYKIECENCRKQEDQQQHEGSYHELPD